MSTWGSRGTGETIRGTGETIRGTDETIRGQVRPLGEQVRPSGEQVRPSGVRWDHQGNRWDHQGSGETIRGQEWPETRGGVKVRSHQKRRDYFARQNHMKSQRTDARGCGRRHIFPGGAFGATQCGRRVHSGTCWAAQFPPRVEIFQLWGDNFATRANQLSSCSARHRCWIRTRRTIMLWTQ